MTSLTERLAQADLHSVYRALKDGDPRAARMLNRLTKRAYSSSTWLHMLEPVCAKLHDDQ